MAESYVARHAAKAHDTMPRNYASPVRDNSAWQCTRLALVSDTGFMVSDTGVQCAP